MTFDVRAVRDLYPALADGHAYLDGAAGTQVPVPVIEAIAAAYRGGIGNLGGAFAASGRSESIVSQARAAVADLVGGTADGVVFGPADRARVPVRGRTVAAVDGRRRDRGLPARP